MAIRAYLTVPGVLYGSLACNIVDRRYQLPQDRDCSVSEQPSYILRIYTVENCSC